MKILNHDEAKNYQISSLNRGHVVFTSLIKFQNKVLFLDSHIERLLSGAQFLFPEHACTDRAEIIKKAVHDTLKDVVDAYLRITIFDDVLFMEKKSFVSSSPTLKLAKAVRIKTPGLLPSFLKHSNYLEADLEIKKVKQSGFDDVVFFDNQGNVTEASTSNIFVVTQENTILTPPLSSNVLQGITRGKLSECLRKNGFTILEHSISEDDLEKAKEIWLTNAVRGVRFVSQFQDKPFQSKNSLYETAIEIFGRFGEKYE